MPHLEEVDKLHLLGSRALRQAPEVVHDHGDGADEHDLQGGARGRGAGGRSLLLAVS
jgi:hypothetical protein